MANGTDPAWSTLDSRARVDKIMDLMKLFAEGTDAFRAACLDPDPTVHRPTIEGAVKVTFDSNFVLQRYADRKSLEDQIVLLFPKKASGTFSPGPVKDYWLCTYVDYVPA